MNFWDTLYITSLFKPIHVILKNLLYVVEKITLRKSVIDLFLYSPTVLEFYSNDGSRAILSFRAPKYGWRSVIKIL